MPRIWVALASPTGPRQSRRRGRGTNGKALKSAPSKAPRISNINELFGLPSIQWRNSGGVSAGIERGNRECDCRPVTPGVAGSSPVRSANKIKKLSDTGYTQKACVPSLVTPWFHYRRTWVRCADMCFCTVSGSVLRYRRSGVSPHQWGILGST